MKSSQLCILIKFLLLFCFIGILFLGLWFWMVCKNGYFFPFGVQLLWTAIYLCLRWDQIEVSTLYLLLWVWVNASANLTEKSFQLLIILTKEQIRSNWMHSNSFYYSDLFFTMYIYYCFFVKKKLHYCFLAFSFLSFTYVASSWLQY